MKSIWIVEGWDGDTEAFATKELAYKEFQARLSMADEIVYEEDFENGDKIREGIFKNCAVPYVLACTETIFFENEGEYNRDFNRTLS